MTDEPNLPEPVRVRNITREPQPIDGFVLAPLAYATVALTERVQQLLDASWLVQVTEDEETGLDPDAEAEQADETPKKRAQRRKPNPEETAS